MGAVASERLRLRVRYFHLARPLPSTDLGLVPLGFVLSQTFSMTGIVSSDYSASTAFAATPRPQPMPGTPSTLVKPRGISQEHLVTLSYLPAQRS